MLPLGLDTIIQNAILIPDPSARSGDLEFFITEGYDPPEDLSDRIWYESDLPISYFGCQFTSDELGPRFLEPLQRERQKDREAMILEWVEEEGGWHNALLRSPVLAIVCDGNTMFLDGWHRTKLAQLAGLTSVRALIGVHLDDMNEVKMWRVDTP